MKFRYKEYCAGTFLLYRKLLSCKVKNAARGCAKAHSLFYERKKKRKQGKVSKNVMDYKLLLDMAVFAGDILMQNGAETYRVEDTVYRILQKSNLKTVQVLVMMTGFVATLDDPTMDSLTVVRRIQSHGTNLEKIDQVNQISREFCNDELTLEQAFKQMKALWKEKEPPKIRLLAFALLTGGFAVMFGSNWAEAIVAAVVGLVGAAVQFSCEKGHMHMFVENIVCSLSVAVAIGFLTAALPGTYDTDLLIISWIMPCVPGAAITNAVFDTLHGDYLSGLARAAEAFVIALAVAIGIGMGLFVMAVVLGR